MVDWKQVEQPRTIMSLRELLKQTSPSAVVEECTALEEAHAALQEETGPLALMPSTPRDHLQTEPVKLDGPGWLPGMPRTWDRTEDALRM